jgi:hypothetical protein
VVSKRRRFEGDKVESSWERCNGASTWCASCAKSEEVLKKHAAHRTSSTLRFNVFGYMEKSMLTTPKNNIKILIVNT